MTFSLDNVVPWGRSYDEYLAMFALQPSDLRRRILGVGDGSASFNSIANKQGGGVVSVDPLYELSLDKLRESIDAVYDEVLAETERNKDEFVWQRFKSVQELGAARRQAMDVFLADFEQGVKEYRYVAAALPSLPFMDRTFELALCSHFLFLYSEHYSLEFHIESIRELNRVAEEVRIFPLTELGAKPSRHLDAILRWLAQSQISADVVKVDYEFQKGANQMLRIGGMG